VSAGGPAASAGIRAGDVVIAVDGRPVGQPEELVVAIRTKQPGQVLRLTYRRGTSVLTAEVVLGSRTG